MARSIPNKRKRSVLNLTQIDKGFNRIGTKLVKWGTWLTRCNERRKFPELKEVNERWREGFLTGLLTKHGFDDVYGVSHALFRFASLSSSGLHIGRIEMKTTLEYFEGQQAYRDGKSLDDNPYSKLVNGAFQWDDDSQRWQNGWADAYAEWAEGRTNERTHNPCQ